MHGKGVYTWPDGRKYEGDYFKDKKHGFGIYTMNEGKQYEGQWKDGKMHGEGLYRKKGKEVKGIWENGKPVKWLNQKDDNNDEFAMSFDGSPQKE